MDAGRDETVPAKRRLPDGTRVGDVRLHVTNLERSVAYYHALLGLEVLERSRDVAALAAREAGRPLIVLVEEAGARPVPPGGLLGLFHFAILLPSRQSLGRFVRHLSIRGVPFASADHLVSEAIYLSDPDGLGIEVYGDRPRAAWRMRDGELMMTTEPLDLRSLAEAGGPEPWDGMPAGTTMGHVHLSVGDLGGARALYHSALGLDETVRSYPGALFLSAGGYHHHLGLNTWSARARVAGEGDARLVEWTLLLPDADSIRHAAADLQARGHAVSAAGNDRSTTDPLGVAVRLTLP